MRWISFTLLPLALAAAEKAAYDSNGRIIALLSGAEDLEVASQVVAVLPSGKRIPLQIRRENAGARRQSGLSWSEPFTLPDGGRGTLALKSEETDGVRYTVSLTADSALEVEAIEFVLDLPRLPFLNGSVAASSTPSVPLVLECAPRDLYCSTAILSSCTSPAPRLRSRWMRRSTTPPVPP